jgi:hypothetical protein
MYIKNPGINQNKNILILLMVTAFLIGQTYSVTSQEPPSKIKYFPPRFIFELSGSFNLPVQDAYGHLQDFFTFKDYGLVHGIGFHFNIKYAANKKAALFPYISLGFAQLQNNDFGIAFIDSNNISSGYPLPGSATYNATPGNSVLMIRDFYAGIGVQYIFRTSKPVMPFAGILLDYNYLWGYYVQTPNIPIGENPAAQETFTIRSTSRAGIGAEAGIDYRISQNLGFVFGTRYKLSNLFGKSSDYVKPVSEDPGSKNTMTLLDKADTGLNTNLNKSRNLAYLEFYLGFAIFIGKTK